VAVNYLTIVPNNYQNDKRNKFKTISFGISAKPRSNALIGQVLKDPLNSAAKLVSLPGIYEESAKAFLSECFRRGIAPADYFAQMLGAKKFIPKVIPVPSITNRIQGTNIAATSLMDGGQIFARMLKDLQSAEKSIQIKMFEFQNLKVDGDTWKSLGAENVPGFAEQQAILQTLITKKRTNPNMKIQVILDSHKWGMDSNGRRKHYNNQDMIVYLKKNGIDVVPAPRQDQGGSVLHHDKYIIVDRKKAIIGGMNIGTHSSANHDFCFAFERVEGRNSEIDNLMKDFNDNWKFSWHVLGEKKLVAGPLNEAEQQFYHGINKEIKPENVSFYNAMKDFFETTAAKGRYKEGRLDLIPCQPVKNPVIKFLDTKPAELSEIGEKGSESAYEYLLKEAREAKEIFGELFYFTNKEIRNTLYERVKAGKLKAQFVMHEADFPYCKGAYFDMIENGLDVRIYKEDKSVSQRMHAKWLVFDNRRVLVGSPNVSDRALMQNLGVGFRDDAPLTSERVEEQIKRYTNQVKVYEECLKLPHIKWDGTAASYATLMKVRNTLKTVYTRLQADGKAEFNLLGKHYSMDAAESAVTIDGTKYSYKEKDDRGTLAILRKIRGCYGNIIERHNAKPKFQRGNNESAVVVDSPVFVKDVFKPQFERDWAHSKSEFEAQHKIKPVYIPPSRLKTVQED